MLTLTFKFGDLVRYTGVGGPQLGSWIRSGLLTPDVKDARSSGDHRVFSMVNLIEVAQAVEMTRVGLTPQHMRLLFAAQRTQLAKLPVEYRAAGAWTNYVRQVMKDAELLGETCDPRYVAWVSEIARMLRRVEKRTESASDTRMLELLAAAQQAPRSPRADRELAIEQ